MNVRIRVCVRERESVCVSVRECVREYECLGERARESVCEESDLTCPHATIDPDV